ncbi:MAG TPA: hypothetical protein VKG68_03105 [Candidatus Binatus sp.]|nr:hypothetical protein [Candidatus Binatus sp.]
MTLAERLQVFEAGGWRSTDADELATMCDDNGDLSVIGIPRHLLKRWWDMAERDATDAEFKSYSLEIAQYFQYKNWSIPTVNVLMSVVAAGGKRDEALVPSHPMRFAEGVGTLIAAINLDDENAVIAAGTESAKIRVILEPGEGLTFPASGVLWNRSVLGDSDLAVTLLIGSLATE